MNGETMQVDPKYKLDFLHSDYHDSSYYIESPTGKRVWIDNTYREKSKEFVEELNALLGSFKPA